MTANRIRLEFTDELRFAKEDDAFLTVPSVKIWIADGPAGNITSSRKPAVKLEADSRPALLRSLAAWIEQENDPGLAKMAAGFAAQAAAL